MLSIRYGNDANRLHALVQCGVLLLLGVWSFDPVATVLAAGPSASLPSPVGRKVDFVADIEPLLRKRCHQCHGPDTQEGGLRLDRRADALAGGGRGPAVVPGVSVNSRLVRFAAGVNDEQFVMPPEGKRLTAEEIGLLPRLDR